MANKEQQRQKKLAKKRSKEIAKKKSLAREKAVMQSFSGKLKAAAEGTVDRCFISEALFGTGKMGSVLISRKMRDGRLGCVRFLVDAMCLGVKDVHAFFAYPAQLTEMVREMEAEELRQASPAAGRKLVEGAVAFARQFELEPHADYLKVEVIWNGIDANDCQTEFEFGDNGKPAYIMGPFDTPMRTAEILMKLNQNAGEDNYIVDYEDAYGLGDLEQDGWGDDPELDVDIDEDVIETTATVKNIEG